MYIVIKPKLWYTTFYSTTGRKYRLTCETYLPENQELNTSRQPVAIREYGKAGHEVLTAHYNDGSLANFYNIHDAVKGDLTNPANQGGSIVSFELADEYGVN